MCQVVTDELYMRALRVAVELKQELEPRILGQTTACGWQLQTLHIPSRYRDQIARARAWECWAAKERMDTSRRFLTDYIPAGEVYRLFNDRFAGLEVCIDHAGMHLLNQPEVYGPQFTPSNRFLVVSDDRPAFIRPRPDSTPLAWLDAELRCDRHRHGYYQLACNADPFQFGQRCGRLGDYAQLQPVHLNPTWCVVPLEARSVIDFVPIARLSNFDERLGEATFELDVSVEQFEPAAA